MLFLQKNSKSRPSYVVLSLFILGELGRFMCVVTSMLSSPASKTVLQ
jgi:hypothetical protein